MIQLKSVVKRSDKATDQRDILRRVSCTFERGNDYVILGNRGEGKSTLLKLLCGVSRPNSGQIIRRGNISVPPGTKLLPSNSSSVIDYIRLVGVIYGLDYKELFRFVDNLADIGDSKDTPIQELTQAASWRLTTAVSYAIPAVFYLFDVNYASGDKEFKERCDPLYDERRKTANVIHVANFTSRTSASWAGFKAVILDQGKLLFFDSFEEAAEILREEAVAATYGTLEYASLLIREGRLREACEYLEYFTGQYPNEKAAVLLLTQLYLRLDELEKAETTGTLFVQRFSATGDIALTLAMIMERRKLYAGAVSWAEHYLKQEPQNREALFIRARSLEKLGLYSDAGGAWEGMIALSIGPAAKMALRAYSLDKNWTDMLALADRLNSADNADGSIEARCTALLNLQQWPEMIEATKRLVTIDPHGALRVTSSAIGKMDLTYLPLLISTLTPIAIADQELRNLMSNVQTQLQRNARIAGRNGTEAEVFAWSESLAYLEDRG